MHLLSFLSSVYKRFIQALFWFAGLSIVFVFAVVIADVTVRYFGSASLEWASAYVEYALLFSAMAAAPWLVRTNGHISVEILSSALSPAMQRLLARLVSAVCAALCAVLAYYALETAMDMAARGDLDIRSVAIPRWVLYAVFFVGVALCAVEFARQTLIPAQHAGHGNNPSGI